VLDRPSGGLMDCRLHPSEMVGRERSYQSVIRRCRWCRWPYRCFLADPEPEAGELLIVVYRLGTAVHCCPLGLLLAFSRPLARSARWVTRCSFRYPPLHTEPTRTKRHRLEARVTLITSSPRYSPVVAAPLRPSHCR
jgi:hypothetical protein